MNNLGLIFLALFLQLYGCQRLLCGHAPSGLLLCWSGWSACGLLLPGSHQHLFSSAFLFAANFLLVSLPLALELQGWTGRRWLLLLGFLAFCGCPPFSTFLAYFRIYIFLEWMSTSVSIFSAQGLLAPLAMLCMVYQTGALGYFYWSHVMRQRDAAAPVRAWSAWWLRLGLVLSTMLHYLPYDYIRALQRLAAFLKPVPSPG